MCIVTKFEIQSHFTKKSYENKKYHLHRIKIQEFCPPVHMQMIFIIFHMIFCKMRIESHILWRCTSIGALLVCIILNVLKTPKYDFANGFHDRIEDVVLHWVICQNSISYSNTTSHKNSHSSPNPLLYFPSSLFSWNLAYADLLWAENILLLRSTSAAGLTTSKFSSQPT